MTPKVGIVTDSLACLTRELVEQHGIRIVPLSIYFGDKVYKDWVDITPSEAYELFLKDPESWYSTAPSPMDFLAAYREVSKRTKNILCVTISSKLSTTYDVAQVAKGQAEAELPGISIEVLDSRTTTAAEGFVALAAAQAAAEGKDLAEVTKTAEEMRERVTFVALLDTVRYVYRSGRIPKLAARAGSILNIKPIFTISSGVVRTVGIVRSKEHGVERLLKIMRDKVGQIPVHVAVMHAYALDEAKRLKERVLSEFNCAELWLTEFSPLMGYTTGTGTLGLAFYKEG
ncbi:DegV domain-containing protein [subsurface metagenome]